MVLTPYQEIPVLALPPLLMFPRTHASIRVPHSFYTTMLYHGFSKNGFLGTVIREQKASEHSTILPIGCVAKVCRVQEIASGRAVQVHLHGVQRFLIKDSCFEGDSGQAKIELLNDRPGRLSPRRRTTLFAALRHSILVRDVLPEPELDCTAGSDETLLVNRVCCESDLPLADKYLLLEADTIDQRCGRLLDVLRFKLDAIRSNLNSCSEDE